MGDRARRVNLPLVSSGEDEDSAAKDCEDRRGLDREDWEATELRLLARRACSCSEICDGPGTGRERGQWAGAGVVGMGGICEGGTRGGWTLAVRVMMPYRLLG